MISSRFGFAAIRSRKIESRPSEETIDSLERFVGRKNGDVNKTFCTSSTFNLDTSRESRRGKEVHDNGCTELRFRVIDSNLIDGGSNCRRRF